MPETLAVIPTYLRRKLDLEVTERTLRTLRAVEPDLEILVVDDSSPEPELVVKLADRASALNVRLTAKEENSGFARTVNVGLREARKRGMDAVLVNADMEFWEPWVENAQQTPDTQGRPAAVVGALLLYSNGLIQSAGTFASFLTRYFDHRYRYAPAPLPEAQIPCMCPVTGALQFIRHECLVAVGLYDEEFRMGYEDVDYCLRVFEAGLECIYNPAVRAFHYESLFRGQASETLDTWHRDSLALLLTKHDQTDLARYIPVTM